MGLSPRDRGTTYLNGIGEAHFFSRRFDKAAANLLASLDLAPTFPVTYRVLASCYAHMGRLDDAQEIVRRLRDYACHNGARHPVSRPGTPRAFSLRSAPRGRRGELNRMYRPVNSAAAYPDVSDQRKGLMMITPSTSRPWVRSSV